jgi:hypothetical protein
MYEVFPSHDRENNGNANSVTDDLYFIYQVLLSHELIIAPNATPH